MGKRNAPPDLQWLRQVVRYDPDTGEIVRLKSNKGPNNRPGRVLGYKTKDGHIEINLSGKKWLAHRLAWYLTYAEWPHEIDHKNGVASDNRISNLRVATHSQNIANAGSRRSGMLKGAYRCSDGSGRWFSSIRIAEKNVHLGRFDTPEEAHAAYAKAAAAQFGEFARL